MCLAKSICMLPCSLLLLALVLSLLCSAYVHQFIVLGDVCSCMVAVSCRLLRDRFLTMEEEEEDEEPRLSLFQMTGSLTRGQAAKLFYQICGKSLYPVSSDHGIQLSSKL